MKGLMQTFYRSVPLFIALTMPASAQDTGVAVRGDVSIRQEAGDRRTVDLTIYNQNLSLIREERFMSIPGGISTVVVPDIPATIDGTSLHFASLTDPGAVRILEQNYQYDLVSQSKLLERYLGRQVEFIRVNPETKKEYTVTGTLLSSSFGMVAEINGKVEINPTGRLILPSLPDGLILRPQLSWLVSNNHRGGQKTELSYLAGQLSWACNYVAILDAADNRLDLTGWVTVTNNSGTSFSNAGLKLVAGDVNIVRRDFGEMLRASKSVAAQDAVAPQFAQSELFEYKLYSLKRRTDLANDETKQIELASGHGVPAKKVFVYDGLQDQWRSWYNNPSYRSQQTFGEVSNSKVGVFVEFKNEETAGLGIPLPKGKVRVYKRDVDGKEQFIGEDEIDHTPKDEQVRLYLGNAFDVVGSRSQMDFRVLASGRVVEETIEIHVRNHKKESISVQVHEHPWRWSEWEIVRANSDWQKVDQSTLKFPVRLGPDREKVITYTIRYSW